MKKSYLQILKQIDALKVEAEKLRAVEVQGVVKRIREAIEHYQLTAADLGLTDSAGAPAQSAAAAKLFGTAKSANGKSAAGPKKRRMKTGKSPFPVATVKFRNEAGNTWGGRGKRPQWLRDALNSGKQLQDFLVKP